MLLLLLLGHPEGVQQARQTAGGRTESVPVLLLLLGHPEGVLQAMQELQEEQNYPTLVSGVIVLIHTILPFLIPPLVS